MFDVDFTPSAKDRAAIESLLDRGYTLKVFRGEGGRTRVSGTCGNGHAVNARPQTLAKSEKCKRCRREAALFAAQREGYDVALELRNRGGRNFSFLVGCCPDEHPVIIESGNFVRGTRCGDCRADEIRSQQEAEAREAGFDVRVVHRQDRTQRTAWLVGTCPSGHSFEMRASNFLSAGHRCRACRDDAVEARALDAAAAAGYDVHLELRARTRKGSDRSRVLVGKCPEGHAVSLVASSFVGQGVRCGTCRRHGYQVNLPGLFYLLPGTVDGLRCFKVGIFNPGSTRLQKHSASGFRSPILAYRSNDGAAIKDMENEALERIHAAGGPSLAQRGIRFPGATETFEETFDARLLVDLVRDAKDVAQHRSDCLIVAVATAHAVNASKRSARTGDLYLPIEVKMTGSITLEGSEESNG